MHTCGIDSVLIEAHFVSFFSCWVSVVIEIKDACARIIAIVASTSYKNRGNQSSQ